MRQLKDKVDIFVNVNDIFVNVNDIFVNVNDIFVNVSFRRNLIKNSASIKLDYKLHLKVKKYQIKRACVFFFPNES